MKNKLQTSFSWNNVFTPLVDEISETTEPILMKFLLHVPYNYAQGIFFCRQTVSKETRFFRKISAILLFMHIYPKLWFAP